MELKEIKIYGIRIEKRELKLIKIKWMKLIKIELTLMSYLCYTNVSGHSS